MARIMLLRRDNIQETPSFGASLNTDYILGMAKMEGGVKILLDIDKVLRPQEMEMLKNQEA